MLAVIVHLLLLLPAVCLHVTRHEGPATQISNPGLTTRVVFPVRAFPLPAGRAGYGWVLFDLASGRLAARGCMSLRYRQTASQAEFEGLLAGLRAALDARVASLAVQVGGAVLATPQLQQQQPARCSSTGGLGVARQLPAELLDTPGSSCSCHSSC